jgi:hypothetical protein
MKHPLVALARTVDWRFLEGRFGEVYTDDDHRVFVVRIIRQGLEKTLPNPARGPARKALVGVLPVAEALCFGSAEPCKVG